MGRLKVKDPLNAGPRKRLTESQGSKKSNTLKLTERIAGLENEGTSSTL